MVTQIIVSFLAYYMSIYFLIELATKTIRLNQTTYTTFLYIFYARHVITGVLFFVIIIKFIKSALYALDFPTMNKPRPVDLSYFRLHIFEFLQTSLGYNTYFVAVGRSFIEVLLNLPVFHRVSQTNNRDVKQFEYSCLHVEGLLTLRLEKLGIIVLLDLLFQLLLRLFFNGVFVVNGSILVQILHECQLL